MAKLKDGCVKPVKGPIAPPSSGKKWHVKDTIKEVKRMTARVGKEAPDFEATAFVEGKGFDQLNAKKVKILEIIKKPNCLILRAKIVK